MNRKIYLIIIWTITLFVICFSCFRFTDKLGSLSFFNSSENNTSDSENEWNDDEEDNDNGQTGYKYSGELKEFSAIDADTKVLGITVKNGSGYKIEWNVSKKKLVPSYSLENGTLKITQGKINNNSNLNHAQLIVTIPEGVQLSKVDIHTNVGEIDLSGFAAEECKVKANVGAIRVEDFDFDKLEAKTNVGEISVYVDDDIEDLNLNLKTNVGEVQVGGKGYRKSYSQSGSGKKISAETNVGAVSIK